MTVPDWLLPRFVMIVDTPRIRRAHRSKRPTLLPEPALAASAARSVPELYPKESTLRCVMEVEADIVRPPLEVLSKLNHHSVGSRNVDVYFHGYLTKQSSGSVGGQRSSRASRAGRIIRPHDRPNRTRPCRGIPEDPVGRQRARRTDRQLHHDDKRLHAA